MLARYTLRTLASPTLADNAFFGRLRPLPLRLLAQVIHRTQQGELEGVVAHRELAQRGQHYALRTPLASTRQIQRLGVLEAIGAEHGFLHVHELHYA